MTSSRVSSWMSAFALACAILMHVAQAAPQGTPAAPAAAPEPLPATIEFNRDIRPILSDKCFKCHGPGSQMAALRFDLEDGAKQALRGGRFAIVPGDPAKSQMIKRITATESRGPDAAEPGRRGGGRAAHRAGRSRC